MHWRPGVENARSSRLFLFYFIKHFLLIYTFLPCAPSPPSHSPTIIHCHCNWKNLTTHDRLPSKQKIIIDDTEAYETEKTFLKHFLLYFFFVFFFQKSFLLCLHCSKGVQQQLNIISQKRWHHRQRDTSINWKNYPGLVVVDVAYWWGRRLLSSRGVPSAHASPWPAPDSTHPDSSPGGGASSRGRRWRGTTGVLRPFLLLHVQPVVVEVDGLRKKKFSQTWFDIFFNIKYSTSPIIRY